MANAAAISSLSAFSSSSSSSLPTPSPTSSSSSILQLHSVFAHLDSISPSLPSSQSLTLPKLKEALAIYAQWSFPSSSNAEESEEGEEGDRRRRRRQEREDWVKDIIEAIDINKNGKIEFNELLKTIETTTEERQRRPQKAEEDEEEHWEPTRDNVRAIFNAVDKDRDGFLSIVELKALMRSQGVDYVSEEELHEIAVSIDPAAKSAGGVSFPAFLRMMSNAPQ